VSTLYGREGGDLSPVLHVAQLRAAPRLVALRPAARREQHERDVAREARVAHRAGLRRGRGALREPRRGVEGRVLWEGLWAQIAASSRMPSEPGP